MKLFHVIVYSFCFCTLLLFCQSAYAQRSVSARSKALLDSALTLIGMKASDLTMPADILSYDRHRLTIHDKLFIEPLYALDFADQMADNLAGNDPQLVDALFNSVLVSLDLGTYKQVWYDGLLSADEVVSRLGVDPSNKLNVVGTTVTFRILSAIVQALNGMEAAREKIRSSPIVVSNLDSLWRQTRDDETSTLWDMHRDQELGRDLAHKVYREAPTTVGVDIALHGLSLYQQLLVYIEQAGSNLDLIKDSIRTVTFRSSIGRIGIGGKEDNLWEGSYAVIIDVGGNDIYRLSDSTISDAREMSTRIIVDLEGADTYLSSGSDFGSGILGVGILIDRTGNDLYNAGDYSLGCGLLGVGILHDMDGDDVYSSGSNTQGCGIFGIGLFIDDNGHDTYRCQSQAQGFGGTRGVGILSDKKGNDRYIASSPFVDVLRYDSHQVSFAQGAALGSRPIASGGIGLLVDFEGNDLYSSDIYGQGTGYWFSLGALIDRSGDDRYESYQYAQGAGVHFATGILRDHSGDDVYVSHGVSQGCGHDIATGILLDDQGNDVYVCESLSLGGGNANAISLLLDEQGNDSYVATNSTNTMGFSDFRRDYGMIGLFIDGGGDDLYGERTKNNTSITKSTYGVFLDAKGLPTPTSKAVELNQPLQVLTTTVDSLFIQASAAPLRFQPMVGPARKALGELGVDALAVLEKHMATQMPRERLTLEAVLPDIYKRHPDSVVSILLRGLESDDLPTIGLCSTVSGKVKDKALVQQLIIMTLNSIWRIRRIAAHTLGDIGDTVARSALTLLLADKHSYVRQRAAFALGKMRGTTLTSLQSALLDDEQIVRNAAIEGLLRGTPRPVDEILAWINTINDRTILVSSLRLLINVDTTKADQTRLASWRKNAPGWLLPSINSIDALLLPPHRAPSLQGKPPVKKRKKQQQ